MIPFTDEDLIVTEGLSRMKLAQASGKPWFVALGMHRPHYPSRLPQKWLGPEIYPGPVDPPRSPHGPTGVPYMSGAYKDGDYRYAAKGCPNCSAPTADAIEYRRWYYAAVSYSDHMLGQALDYLTQLGPAVVANTIVVFHSDHGYQLGEQNEWSKKTNTELAARVPLIIRVPWKMASVGQRTKVRAELVDLYRTLVDLAGLDAATIQADVQGVSLAPLFDTPQTPPPGLVAKAAYSQIGRCACKQYTVGNWTGLECDHGACAGVPLAQFDFMGYSIITHDGWRYTVWVQFNPTTLRVDWTKPTFDELYDLTADPHNDFDYDGYATNVAMHYPDKVTAYRAAMQTAVNSWY